MINPIIFTIRIGDFAWPVHWYGVIVVIGMFVGAWIVERELKHRGENSDLIWDAMVWVLIPGIIGARLWFVVNAILGGDTTYTQNPVEILKTWNGGLHIFGGLLFGAIALLTYIRWNKLDPWVFLDSAGPAVLVGQAIGRIGNFINQELYGPPTTLPWGFRINPTYGLYQVPMEVRGRSSQEILNYLETTRFHPTFAYEMLWNFFAAGLLLWLSRRYKKDLKPGALFSAWLLLAGFGRVVIEFYRPDQPRIEGLGISYSSIVAALMAVIGAVMLMARYKAINLKFAEAWEEEYQLSTQANKPQAEGVEEQDVPEIKVTKKAASAKTRAATAKKVTKAKSTDTATAVEPEARTTRKTTTRTKKSS